MQIRQVVTGHDAKGRAVVARDEQVDGTPIPGLGEIAFLWSADEPATYPNAGDNPAAPVLFPPVGGVRVMITSYSPESGVVAPDANKDPSSGIHSEDDDEPGMHRTDSTDFGVVLSGSLICELDDGAEVLLSAGDVVVQNGTRHRWRVVGDVPAVMAVFITGAHRV
jgi:mannose-6-phosphate isomerase-like protein (cupin superfamily)